MKNSKNSIADGLNSQQLQAVRSPFDSHTLVLAGAGCGKTLVLTQRIINCIESYCLPDQILALTFGRKASLEMRNRFNLYADKIGVKRYPVIATFHSFALSLLKDKSFDNIPNYLKIGYTKEPKILSEDNKKNILANITTSKDRFLFGGGLANLSDFISKYQVNKSNIVKSNKDIVDVLKRINTEFLNEKIKLGYWEFSDIIYGSLNLLKRNPKLALFYSSKYKHILVDEFQDTNPLQVSFLKRLISNGDNTVFAVGDDDQAIYGFRGADVESIINFHKYFANANIVKLEKNYRNSKPILSLANKIFEDKKINKKVLICGKTALNNSPKPSKYRFNNQIKMMEWIIKQSQKISAETNISVDRMRILFRTNESLNYCKKFAVNTVKYKMPQMITIHAGKGMEFPVVFLCDLEEGKFPRYELPKNKDIKTWRDVISKIFDIFFQKNMKIESLEEEKRLFYVGVTRAERYLYLLSVKKSFHRSRMIKMRPSRFLRFV